MSKLVRDLIPEIIRASGREPSISFVDGQDRVSALFDKFDEELSELRLADDEAVLEEAADVYEVLLSLLAHHGFSRLDLDMAAAQKRAERGGFGAGVVLDSVSNPGSLPMN
ncbi:nucleoside triphosphate pyrophosphohydrolase [Hoyosella rhizosphaerae]|uniref:Phosphoribosyl-ATP pyrophosphohydrolase n=1 Tax=Hoyosella rhizosphaerae TaxID=1755582 RepID=A0A916TZT2_9ACTN|nr:nucleoside triphosphate pyrophosphohydrolase [Hoyosella rhizosphaerae]MBN4927103.1 nucleoside triphosphate pyrophosphohydrolase [Hoyosella rhizosphaerae]GGC54022.1 phosphoribosyl-ATP pyrophosphohydrolase [Hoyosella rhizosphaerae]